MTKKQVELSGTSISTRWPPALRALRHRNFRLFWFGQLVSLSGWWMQTVALSWLLYQLTDSPLMLGLLSFVVLLPVGLVSLAGGVISDRVPRRKLILATQTILALQALMLTLLAWRGLVEVWHIMVVTFVVGAADALEQPARFALLPEIVGREDLTNAVGLNASMVNVARALGPIVSGMLIGSSGEASAFFVNFVTYLVVIAAFLLMNLPAEHGPRRPVHLKSDLLAGLEYMWQNQTIRSLLVLIAGLSALSQSYLILLPVFARDLLQVGPSGYGWLIGATGVGAVCGALTAANVKEGRRGRWLIVTSLAFPLFLLLFAFSRWAIPSAGLVFLAGASQFMQQVLVVSLLQLAAANEFHGRVASLFALITNGFTRLGGTYAGAVAQYCNAPVAVASGALLSLVWVIGATWRMPFIRSLR